MLPHTLLSLDRLRVSVFCLPQAKIVCSLERRSTGVGRNGADEVLSFVIITSLSLSLSLFTLFTPSRMNLSQLLLPLAGGV